MATKQCSFCTDCTICYTAITTLWFSCKIGDFETAQLVCLQDNAWWHSLIRLSFSKLHLEINIWQFVAMCILTYWGDFIWIQLFQNMAQKKLSPQTCNEISTQVFVKKSCTFPAILYVVCFCTCLLFANWLVKLTPGCGNKVARNRGVFLSLWTNIFDRIWFNYLGKDHFRLNKIVNLSSFVIELRMYIKI